MSARGATIPGAGNLPVSVVWRTLPMELVEQVLQKAVPEHYVVYIEEGHRHSYIHLQPLYTPNPEPWKILFGLCKVSRRTRLRAIGSFERTSIVEFRGCQRFVRPLHQQCLETWLSRCSRVEVTVERFIQIPERFHMRHNPAGTRTTTALRALSTTIMSASPQQTQNHFNVQWQIQSTRPIYEEVGILRKYMKGFQSHLFHNISQRLSFERRARRCWRVLRTCVDRYPPPEDVIESRGEYGIPRELSTGVWTDTSLLAMERLEEDMGRKEVLDVLWVFLPYFQPDADLEAQVMLALEE
ncbi:uncharacterized protein RCC_08756 [Ramularia collo-cygni]|uniref:Uncharacterized protein n=1 Tax=Ramularia collo-cygni TaxID=112498 RepID=A0A2D3V0Y3_9PEZI|nr:uncharacterized protein RCC_08756 [Ramularia collo-cygni]CZT23046.1 uncharacterized protein RCC_08756 [Ramularia collo-cygni]